MVVHRVEGPEDLPLRCPEPQARTDADGRLRTAVVTTGLGQDFGTGECLLHSLGDFGRAGSTTSAPTDILDGGGTLGAEPLLGSDLFGTELCDWGFLMTRLMTCWDWTTGGSSALPRHGAGSNMITIGYVPA